MIVIGSDKMRDLAVVDSGAARANRKKVGLLQSCAPRLA